MVKRHFMTLTVSSSLMLNACGGKKNSNEGLEEKRIFTEERKVVEVPVVDKGGVDDKAFVKEQLAIVNDEKRSSLDRAKAIEKLKPFAANFASVATMAVGIAKNSTDRELLKVVADLLAESKLSSPSIVESEIAIYSKMSDKAVRDTQTGKDTRMTIAKSINNKLQNDIKLLQSVKVRKLQRDMTVDETDVEISLVALDGYFIEPSIWTELKASYAQSGDDLSSFVVSRFDELLYIVSGRGFSLEFNDKNEVVGLMTNETNVVTDIADWTSEKSEPLVAKAFTIMKQLVVTAEVASPYIKQDIAQKLAWIAEATKKVKKTTEEAAKLTYFSVGKAGYDFLSFLGLM